MGSITFTLADGTACKVETSTGRSVMQIAVANDVHGIIGECGGNAMCATCHVYVDSGADTQPPVSDVEDEMLDCTASPRETNSRLSCQLFITDGSGDLSVSIPDSQL
jgi:2Fe-2S ferredoxin